MTINLSGQREQIVLSLLRTGKFASAEDVIDEALRLVGQRHDDAAATNDAARSVQQLENLKLLGQRLDAMPTAAVANELTDRDHDRILYGK